jgi:RimJ/RimL family protein N-acetyltransferase/uncharacterized damage-inducible protein DinB
LRPPPEEIDAGVVMLRRWQDAWATEIAEAVRVSRPELQAYMAWATDDYELDRAQEFLRQAGQDWDAGIEFVYAIWTLAGEIVGSASLMTRMGPGILEIGFWIHTAFTGRGFATAAARALTEAALAMDGVDRVAIRHDAGNAASGRVAAKAGFTEVGRRPSTLGPGRLRTDVEVIWERIGAQDRWPRMPPAGRLSDMTESRTKADLHRYLQLAREALLWKLDGLSEYDVRRPMVPTGTNLLGLVKHVASIELGYFGDTFGRPFEEPLTWWAEDAEPNADMWATAEESRDEIVDLYHRAWKHADATIDMLALEAIGRVPWWPDDRSEVTLHRILVHVIAETNRHAGHADIVRELIDGAVGLRRDNDNMYPAEREWWETYRGRLEAVAREAARLHDQTGG